MFSIGTSRDLSQQRSSHDVRLKASADDYNFVEVESYMTNILEESRDEIEVITFVHIAKRLNQFEYKQRENIEEDARKCAEWMMEFHKQGRLVGPPAISVFARHIDSIGQTVYKRLSLRTNEAEIIRHCVDIAKSREAALDTVIQLCESGIPSLKPKSRMFEAVVYGYARAGLPQDAERILQTMFQHFKDGNKNVKPSALNFSHVIQAWRLSKDPTGPERCEAILDHMIKLHAQGILEEHPPAYIYIDVMACWAALQNWEEVDRLYERMKRDGALAPAYATGNAWRRLMIAYLVSGAPDAGEKADICMERILDMGIQPRMWVYRAAKECWHQSWSMQSSPEVDE